MNYRHIYHAGNFADVFKHIVLVTLLRALQIKEKGFCYIDTHSGIGRYDLHSIESQKTQEFSTGIQQLLTQKTTAPGEIPDEVQAYLNAVNSINARESLAPRFYPGSPLIARYFLRPQDKMILTELHPHDYALLKNEFFKDPQVVVQQQNGYLALKAYLPPRERRGLVFIDPPFEQDDEIYQIYAALQEALKRWATGIYAIWYPLKKKHLTLALYQQLKKLNAKEILIAELSLYAESSEISFNGCGMAIINPPWQLDTQLQFLTAWLWKTLSAEKKGGFRVLFSNKI